MFEIKDKVEDIAHNLEKIANDYYRLSVVQVADKGSNLGASLMITLLVFALLFFSLLFAGIGLSYWIGQKLQSPMLGFFIVGGALFVILLIIIALKRKVLQPFIRNVIINKIYA